MTWQHSRKSRSLLLSVFVAATAWPLAAAPPTSVNVVFEKAETVFNDAYVYQTIAGDTEDSPTRARLAIDLFLRNDETFPIMIDHVTLHFDQPAIASMVLENGLQMKCGNNDTMMTIPSSYLVMPAGTQCRLGLTPDPLLNLPVPGRLGISVAYKGILLATTIPERDLVPYTNTTETGTYRFPARAADLPAGQFWSGRPALSGKHHRFTSRTNNDEVYAYDLGVIRKNASGIWVSYKELEAGDTVVNDENDDFLCWGVPVYAMADGIVDNFDDGNNDNLPGEIPNGAQPNFFSIAHGEEKVWYGHLRKDSLNPLLMAAGAVVKEGDYLGQCGNSGSSSAPHLHVQVVRNGDPMPLHFSDAFVIERNTALVDPLQGNSPWSTLNKKGLPPSQAAISAAGLRRRDDTADVGITDVALVSPNSTRTVTASRTAGGNLRTSLWRTDSSGDAVLLASDSGGGVDKVALAVPNSTQDAALAMITAAGNLKLVGYDVTTNGISRAGEYNSTAALDVAAAAAPYSKGIVTALRTTTDGLRIAAWTVDPAASQILFRGELTTGTSREVAMVRTFTFPGVVTAVRNSSDQLKLYTFRIAAGGATITQEDNYQDASVQQISIARLGSRANGDDLVVTACRTLAGTLELVSWSINSAGDITRLEEAQAGTIAEVSTARATSKHVLTSVINGSDDLQVIAWHVADDGTFTRRTESRAGEATVIAQDGAKATFSTDPLMAVTAMADSAGDLRLIVHQVLLTD